MNGIIFDIKKFAINDGPGIRTAVFLKGCPLHCWWCHNPESQSGTPELSFVPEKCIGCGWCSSVCPNGLDRSRCTHCGKCAEHCYAGAREIAGRSASVDEVIAEVLKDKDFYSNSDGGMTISGGEPLYQPEFTLALLQRAKAEGLHTCLDTSGFAAKQILDQVLPFVDIFLYDLKETDAENHSLYTSVPLEIILDNLKYIDAAGAATILRCPLIPGLNVRDSHADGIAAAVNELSHVRQVDLMPYHPLGESKSAHLGKKPLFTGEFANKKDLEEFRLRIQNQVRVPVQFS